MNVHISDIAAFVAETSLVDSHTHLRDEQLWIEEGPDDVLADLFNVYLPSMLRVAGADDDAVDAVWDPAAGDLASRFTGVQKAWEAVKFTGPGEAARLTARIVYGLEELTPTNLEGTRARLAELRRPGGQPRLLRDVARLDHVQSDPNGVGWDVVRRGSDDFLYDLDMGGPQQGGFTHGKLDPEAILEHLGVEVVDLDSLREALTRLFAEHGRYAIAVKAGHAYRRTLRWEERSDADAASALDRVLAGSDDMAARLCLGDWCMARIVELATEHDLPVKIHCGHLDGSGALPAGMGLEDLSPAALCGLLGRYPDARFVLMHLGYPFVDELSAIAMRFPNVWLDFCWAWALDPAQASHVLRRLLHTVPTNKLFVFGSDTQTPTTAVGFAAQARTWLTRALEAEIADGSLTAADTIELAGRLMRENQYACFDVEGRRAALRANADPRPVSA